MATRIQIRRDTEANWNSVDPVLAQGELGLNLDTNQIKIGDGLTAWNSLSYTNLALDINDLDGVTITDAQNGDFLRYSSSASAWINDPVNLSTDTVGDYVQSLVAGTGVSLENNSGEGATPTIAIGQAVSTSSSVTFGHVSAPVTGNVTGDLTGNADTATALETARTISLGGDLSGSVSFDGSQNVTITATVEPDSVALGTDTTGNFVNDVVSGTGVTVTHTPGEGSSASIAIGQDVATSASVTFAHVSADITGNVTGDLTGNADTATALETSRTISLSGDLSGSVSFDGTADVTISATVQPDSVALGTDTTGNYVNDVTAGTGVTVTHTPAEGSSPTIAIGQAVGTSASVTFAHVSADLTGDVTGNADTATALQNARVIALSGDVSGSVSFDGTGNVDISTTIGANSVSLGSDTSGDYVSSLVAGTGVTLSNNSGETATPTVAIGQDVATSASVTFAKVDTTGDLTVGGNLTVNGTTTTLNTETLYIEDNIIVLNSNVSASPSVDAGIEIERGTSANVALRWNESTDKWETTNDGSAYSVIATNGNIALGTDTTGNYMSDVTASTGVTISHTPGEGSTATFSIGQSVDTSASVTFSNVSADLVGNVTGDLTGNADTATALETARTISLGGDLSGSASFNGTSDITISASVVGSSVSIDELSDVVITSVQNGQLLEFDGTNWVNAVRPSSEPIGHENKADSVISFDEGSLTFSIAPVSDSYTVWCAGKRYVKTGTETVQIPDTSGLYYIYFNSSGVLAYRTDFFVWDTDTPTAYIYWNEVDNKAYFFADERHGITLDWATHEYLHRTRGAAIANGFGVSSYSIDGDGSSDDHAKFDLAGGTFFDEDLQVDITHSATPTANTWEQVLEGNAEIPVFYKLNSHWVKDAATEFAFKQGTSRPKYNSYSAPNWSTTDIDNNKFAISWIIATNNLNEPVIAIMGQASYNTIGEAEAAVWEDLNLDGFPIVEFRPLHKTVFQASDSFTNSVNAAIRGIYDLRRVSSGGDAIASTPVSDHGSMTGLSDDDHTQYLNSDRHNALDHSTAMSTVILDDVSDVSVTSPTDGQFLRYNSASTVWVNDTINLGTDTAGDYVQSLVAGTGVTLSNNSGETATPTVAIGQAVETSASVTFANVTADLVGNVTGNLTGDVTGNADTATSLETARTISLGGDLSGSASFDGTSDVTITATVQPDSVALGTDTTGNFMSDVVGGTGVTISHTPGESSSASVAIGQDVATSASVTFAAVTAPVVGNVTGDLTGNADTATALETARTISLTGDVSGSVSFDGTGDVSITATVQPDSVALGTDTTGNYVNDLTGGTGVTITHTPGEGSNPTVAIGQSVATSASVTFAHVAADVTGNVTGNITGSSGSTTGNAATATALQNARTISLSGDVSGSVSFDGTSNVSISATVQPDSVALGTDTTGNYVNDLTAGTGVTITHTPAEGSSPTVAIGQSVATSASVTFAQVNTTGDVVVGGNLTVNGTTTTLNTETLAIEDNIIVLNSNVSASPSVDAGIEVERGTSANVALRWNETSDKWELTEDGATYNEIATADEVSAITISILDDIGDVSASTAAAGDFLKYDGAQWVNDPINLGTDTVGNYVADVVSGAGISISHTPGEGSSASVALNAALDDLSDVSASAPADGEFLKYVSASSAWVPAAIPTINALDDIGDVNASSPNDGDFLKWNGSNWINDTSLNRPSITNPNLGYSTTATSGGSTALDLTSNYRQFFTGTDNHTVVMPQVYNNMLGYTYEIHNDSTESILVTQQNNGATIATLAAGETALITCIFPFNFGTPWAVDIIVSATSVINTLDDIGDVNAPSPTTGYFLKWDGTEWVPAAAGGAVTTTTISANTETTVATFSKTEAESAEFIVKVKQGERRFSDKVLVLHNGTTADFTDFGELSLAATETVAGSGAVTWVTQTSNFGNTQINSVAYGNSLWVAGGDYGQLCSSTDATTWVTRTSNVIGRITSVAYGNSLWVACTYDSELITSTDGTTWTTRTSNFDDASSGILSVAYGNNLWVAAGYNGDLRTSTDAITWVTRTSNFGTDIKSVAYGNNLWVAAGVNSQIRTSTDAITWTTRTSNFGAYENINSVAYGNNLWVAGGYGIRTSTDAITWVTRESNFGAYDYIRSVAYGNNLWVASGDFGQLRSSTDAITWVTQTSNFGESSSIRSVAYGDNLWVAGGYYGQIRTSATDTGTFYVGGGSVSASVSFATDISGSDVRLRMTIPDAGSTSAIVKVLTTTVGES